jgi:hypothetical protein
LKTKNKKEMFKHNTTNTEVKVKKLQFFQIIAIIAYLIGFTLLIVDTLTPYEKTVIILLCINTYFYYEVFLLKTYNKE